jgi:hypothetical protein
MDKDLLKSMLEQKLTTKKPQDFLSSYMNSGVNPYEDKILNPSMLSLSWLLSFIIKEQRIL